MEQVLSILKSRNQIKDTVREIFLSKYENILKESLKHQENSKSFSYLKFREKNIKKAINNFDITATITDVKKNIKRNI